MTTRLGSERRTVRSRRVGRQLLAAGTVAAMVAVLVACSGTGSTQDAKLAMRSAPTTTLAPLDTSGTTPTTVGAGNQAAPGGANPDGSRTSDGAEPPPVTQTPTQETIQQAADRSNQSSFRYTVNLDLGGLGGLSEDSTGGALASGAYDGEQLSMHIDVLAGITGAVGLADLLPLLDLLPADLAEIATADMVLDGDDLYLTTPLFSTLLGVVPSGIPGLEVITTLKQLGEGWAKVRLPGVGLLTSFATTFNGSRNLNPGAILNLLRRIKAVTDLGQDTLDGVPVRGVGGTVNVGDVLTSRGIPISALGQAAVLAEVSFRVEAWVDDEGHVRVAKLYVGQDTFVESMNGAGISDDGLVDLGLMAGIVLRLDDYGALGIDVQVPTNATDLTAPFDLLPDLRDIVPVGGSTSTSSTG